MEPRMSDQDIDAMRREPDELSRKVVRLEIAVAGSLAQLETVISKHPLLARELFIQQELKS